MFVKRLIWLRTIFTDGAERIRTADLLDANEALYQLSHSPKTMHLNLQVYFQRIGSGASKI